MQLLNRAHAQRLADEVRHGFVRQKLGLFFFGKVVWFWVKVDVVRSVQI